MTFSDSRARSKTCTRFDMDDIRRSPAFTIIEVARDTEQSQRREKAATHALLKLFRPIRFGVVGSHDECRRRARASRRTAITRDQASISGRRYRPAQVLVVDDFQVDNLMPRRLLKKWPGARGRRGQEWKEALVVIEGEAPVVVLTDLQMPHMNGLELVMRFARRTPISRYPMTAYGSEEVAIQALRRGRPTTCPRRLIETELLTRSKGCSRSRRWNGVAACERVLERRRESRFRLKNDPDLIAPLIDLLREDLGVMNVCDSTARMQVGVALHEAIANALYHGNLEVSSDLRQDDERHFYSLAEERRGIAPFRDRQIEVHAEVDSAGGDFRRTGRRAWIRCLAHGPRN